MSLVPTDRRKGRADGRNNTRSFPVENIGGTSGYQEVWWAINAGYLYVVDVKVLRLYGRIQNIVLLLTGVCYLQSAGTCSYYVFICACCFFITQAYAVSVILVIIIRPNHHGCIQFDATAWTRLVQYCQSRSQIVWTPAKTFFQLLLQSYLVIISCFIWPCAL